MKALSSKSPATSGFLLIGVLLILALLTVLVVASVMLAQIERRAATNGASTQLAQQNALFALNTALGQLQREAGPDQRITARADILSNIPAPTAANGATAYWTGVWKTYNPNGGLNQQLDVATTTAPTPIRTWSAAQGPHWLVSLPSDALTMSPTNTLTTPTATVVTSSGDVTLSTVTVANVGSAGTAYPVNVPLVPMKTTRTFNATTNEVQTGQYAYWVSDEGIKAKANLIDPQINNKSFSPASYLVDSQRQFLAPAANAIYKILPSPFSATDTTTDIRGNTNYLTRVTSPLSLQYMPTGTSASGWTTATISQNLADITTYSMGVLADVRKGGLKTDLTAAFENGLYTSNTANTTPTASSWFNALFPYCGLVTGAFTGTYDTQYVYRNYNGTVPGKTPYYGQTTAINSAITTNVQFDGQYGAGGPFYDGLHWHSLYYYYNLYKASIPLLVKQTNGTQLTKTNPSVFPYTGTALNYMTAPYPSGVNAVILPLTPVVLAFRLDYSILPQAPAAVGGTWTAQLETYPQIILWNPFSVPLIPPASFTFNQGSGAFRLNGLCLWVGPSGTNWTAKTPTAEFPLNDNVAGRSTFNTLTDANSTPLLPGEIRVYSLGTASNNYSLGNISWTPNPNGNASGGLLVNYPSGTPTPLDEPTSVVANTPNGDYGQIGTINLGTTDTAGNTISATTDYFHVVVGTYQPGGVGPPVVNDSINSTPNNWYGGQPFISPTGNTNEWPVVAAQRVGMGSSINADLTTPPTWTDQPIGNYAASGPYRLIDYENRVKGLKSGSDSTWQGYNSVAPLFMGNSACSNLLNFDDFGSGNYQEVYAGGFNQISISPDTKFIEISNGATQAQNDSVWGLYSAGDPTNQTASPSQTGSNLTNNVVLFDIPNQPMVSLGQFMHMPLYVFDDPASFGELPGATMFVGGSLACPEVPLNQTGNIFCYSNLVDNRLMLDNSFLANQALFDSYFLSTVPPSGGFSFTTTPTGLYTRLNTAFASTTTAQAYIQANNPLPNGRMRYYFDNGNVPTAANLQNPHLAAANLLVDGAFNVNSTSIPAWTALLSSLSNNQLQLWNATTAAAASYTASTLQNPIPRFWSSTSGATGGPWDGTHPLTDAQIKTLATEIVTQVKARGPFLSMADFLNRRLYAGTPTATTGSIGSLYTEGALQAAIDTDTSGINTTALSYGTAITSTNTQAIPNGRSRENTLSQSIYPLPALNTIVSNTAVGTPAYLMQQDIVQDFAPVMTVRSDTFVIRCYGEADNPSNGAVEGRAWGEAVVQRLPDFVDQTDPALTTAPSTTSANVIPPITASIGNATPLYDSNGTPLINATNQTFGRRFKIVSFHWLNSNDL